MARNSASFLVSSHGQPAYNSRLPSSSLKRIGNGSMSFNHSSNSSIGSNMNMSSTMRTSMSMGPMKPVAVNMNSNEKSNSIPYASRYMHKMWPMSRSFHEKNLHGHDEHNSSYLRSGISSHNISSDNPSFAIEPSVGDDNEDEICFSMRHIAAARFQRNQRLLQEVFNEVCIPDLRLNVNADRISTLRRQAHALKEHCETFEKDFTELEQKHVEKKRKFLEENEKFYDDYKQASATDLSEEKINEIIQKHEAMEKLQKEKQLLIQQQQTIPATTQAQLSTTSTTTISQPDTLVTSKAKHESINEIPSQQILTSESTPSLSSSIQTLLPELQSEASQISSSQSTATPSSTIQINESKIPSSQPVQTQVTPPVLQHTPSTSSSQLVSQVYPMMHTNSNHVSTSSYGHYQQGQYRPQMTQRPASYSANVQGQQQQQWSSNTYDSHYYNSYPSNVPWSQHQQQWPMNPSQQPTGTISQIHGPPQHSSQMYGNSVHYGNNSTNTTTWNSGSHSTQQYGYTQNSTYDPRFASVPPSLQMHNPSSSYDYTSSSQ